LPGPAAAVARAVPVRLCQTGAVNFRALNHPRIDMVWVALAGPAINIALAALAAAAFHLIGLVPAGSAQWVADNLKNALVINVVLAVFQHAAAAAAGRRTRRGPDCCPTCWRIRCRGWSLTECLILIAILILLPMLGAQLGLNLDIISQWVRASTGFVIRLLLLLTGNV